MSDQTEKQTYVCPHCGGTDFNLYGSAVRRVSVAPPKNGKPARVEVDDADVDYDLFTCADCGEEVDAPEWVQKQIYDADDESLPAGKTRFVPSFSQILREASDKRKS